MIVGYVVLDGFDLGVGVLHLFLVRNEAERRTTLASIGPVWDGNEVWLLAGGGTLYFAFPLLYASAFSGFYLPLMIVLWLLILRGISIELRNHVDVGVWRALLDGVFGLASALLAIFFGAALANVLRGVPLNADGYFFLPLWTNWQPASILHSRLVYGDRRPGGPRCSHAAWRSLAHHQDLGRPGPARPPHRHPTLACAGCPHRRKPRRHHYRPPSQSEQLLQLPLHLRRSVGVIASMAGIWLSIETHSQSTPFCLRAFTCFSCCPERAGAYIPRYCRRPPGRTATSPLAAPSPAAHARRWPGLVGLWHAARHRLHCLRVRHVSRQGGSPRRCALTV